MMVQIQNSMKTIFTFRFYALLAMMLYSSLFELRAQNAGIASASQDSICSGSNVTLFLNNYNGNIQWQRFNGSIWIDETGSGAQNDTFSVALTASAEFRAFVTATGQADDSSNVITVGVITVNPPSGTGATRCGIGQVSISASGIGVIKWYDSATGGNLISTGNTYQPTVSTTTTYYAEDNINGGQGQASALLITEIEVQTNDRIELQNVSSAPVDVTGWKLVVSDSYTAINSVNSIVQTLNGTIPPGGFLQFSDVTGIPVYWGNNILWNAGGFPGFAGWLMLLDPNNDVKDIVFLNWPAADIASFSPIVQGTAINIGNQWLGNGVSIQNTQAGLSIQRIGNNDNNNSPDWVDASISFQATNPGLTLPLQGFGCSSQRTPVLVTVTPADSISINPASAALCQGQNVTLNAITANPNYVCTWSPAGGLNTTTGLNVIASPTSSTSYVVFADDGTCAASDTVFVEVNTPNIAGNITAGTDSICLGSSTVLNTQSYNGLLQWQQNTGSGFGNAVGSGANSPSLQVSPNQFTEYRLIANSPGCNADTSNTIGISVITADTPITNDTVRCGAGPITLSASGSGTLLWFLNPVGGNPLNTGSTFNTNVFTNTTYHIENRIGGGLLRAGASNNGIGPVVTEQPADQGLLFDVISDCTLETVYVYPDSAGVITFNLRQSAGGPVLGTYSQQVQAGGKTAIPLNFNLIPGLNYRLEIALGSPFLKRNTSGQAFPYSNTLISITSNLTPAASTTGYYFIYDWEVSAGCRSVRVPLTVTVNSIPAAPLISVNGTVLSSSSPTGNQWYLNGSVIPGATSQSYNVTQNGNYSVSVTINGCTAFSDTIFASSINENFSAVQQWMIFPNPGRGDNITLEAELSEKAELGIRVSDAAGREVWYRLLGTRNGKFRETLPLSELSNGLYIVELIADGIVRSNRLSIIK
jgi:hypothetical protein